MTGWSIICPNFLKEFQQAIADRFEAKCVAQKEITSPEPGMG